MESQDCNLLLCLLAVDGCKKYTVLSEAYRAQEYIVQDNLFGCDWHLEAGWYRFQGAAGDRMPDKCVPLHHCGTRNPGWLKGIHPNVSEGAVTREVCYHTQGGCCSRSSIIKVKNCGSYYVYELQRPPGCSYRYCGRGGKFFLTLKKINLNLKLTCDQETHDNK